MDKERANEKPVTSRNRIDFSVRNVSRFSGQVWDMLGYAILFAIGTMVLCGVGYLLMAAFGWWLFPLCVAGYTIGLTYLERRK